MPEQPGLFDLPNVTPLPRPRRPKVGTGPIRYAPYSALSGRCQDCQQVVYEFLCEGRLDAPPVRRAHFKRIQGDEQALLCAEHKADRELDEQRLASRA